MNIVTLLYFAGIMSIMNPHYSLFKQVADPIPCKAKKETARIIDSAQLMGKSRK